MSLRPFLDHLATSPDEMRQFFQHARSTMLRVLGYRFPKIPHQMLEDAVMQAFKQLWGDQLGQFSSVHPVHTELFRAELIRFLARTVAFRRLLDMLEQHKDEILLRDLITSNQDDCSDDTMYESLMPKEDDDPIHDALENLQLVQRLQRCVDHLTPKLSEVIRCVLGDLRQADTALMLGIPEGTVKSRINEAVKKLKRCMGIHSEDV
ncbi:RNA polymerase sigma factor [Undibacterium luofuense]|uniref:RNA polymerase sigma factor n=1 Tax=Undibacterium luofuense TaxID=2828733 RepID=A0A941DPU2_9BURK|nr:RNA polymerase sigma factor [Undibacterium luofuense]MBR7783604.1 RNA polymerase sigma factor [Undibacterium luofuense]